MSGLGVRWEVWSACVQCSEPACWTVGNNGATPRSGICAGPEASRLDQLTSSRGLVRDEKEEVERERDRQTERERQTDREGGEADR